MGKAVAAVGTAIVGVGLVIATGGAILIPAAAGGGLAGAFGTALFGITAGQFVTAGLALNLVGSSLSGMSGAVPGRDPTSWNASQDNPLPFAFGRVGVGGFINHRAAYGPDNRYQSIVTTISRAGPIKGFVGFESADIPTSIGAGGIVTSGEHSGAMWVQRAVGSQPQSALTSPSGLAGGATIPKWGSAYKMSGAAAVMQTMYENSKYTEFQGGVEKALHIVEGKFGWDPRLDSTWPGGSGSCRLNDPSTWVWIDEGCMAGLNWSIGMWEGAGGGGFGIPYASSQVGGIGASLDGIDVAAFVYCANVADAAGFKITAWPDTSEDESVVLDKFLQASGAWRARVAGKISCVSRAAPQPSLMNVTARDTAGDIELAFLPSRRDRKNQAIGYFMSEQHGWKLTPIEPVGKPDWITQDGGKRSKRVDVPYSPFKDQTACLTYYDLADAREPVSGTVPFKPHMRRIKPGDCFTLSEPGFQFDGLKVRALRRTFNPATGVVRISFRQETDSKHDEAYELIGITSPPNDPLPPPVRPGLPAEPPITRDDEGGAVTGGTTEINVASFNLVASDGVVEVPAGTITGLAASKTYGVFYKPGVGLAASELPAFDYMSGDVDGGGWIFLSWQSTDDGAGTFPTRPTPPPGSGGTGDTPAYVE